MQNEVSTTTSVRGKASVEADAKMQAINEHKKRYHKLRYQSDLEYRNRRREQAKKYRERHREKYNAYHQQYHRQRYLNDITYRKLVCARSLARYYNKKSQQQNEE